MQKFLSALGLASIVLPAVAPTIAGTLGPKGAAGVQIAGAVLASTTHALVDVQGIRARRKETKARRKAALR